MHSVEGAPELEMFMAMDPPKHDQEEVTRQWLRPPATARADHPQARGRDLDELLIDKISTG